MKKECSVLILNQQKISIIRTTDVNKYRYENIIHQL